jgi:predicted acetyltransferase
MKLCKTLQSASDSPSFEMVPPSQKHRDSFLEMVSEFHGLSEDWPYGANSGNRRALDDFDGHVREVEDHAKGLNLPEGWVPCNTFWLLVGQRVVGALSLRHRLNDFLEHEGGHIGYCIRPPDRRKGYMTHFLRMALDKARDLGLSRVLITCDKTNVASVGVIRMCGGVLEDERQRWSDRQRIVQRYWVDLAPP